MYRALKLDKLSIALTLIPEHPPSRLRLRGCASLRGARLQSYKKQFHADLGLEEEGVSQKIEEEAVLKAERSGGPSVLEQQLVVQASEGQPSHRSPVKPLPNHKVRVPKVRTRLSLFHPPPWRWQHEPACLNRQEHSPWLDGGSPPSNLSPVLRAVRIE